MSNLATFCDAVLLDLVGNVPALRGVIEHRYAVWSPEQLVAETGERHLAVWPAAEAADEATRLVTGPGGDLLVGLFRVLYWEDAGDESPRGVADEEAASDLLDLLEAVRGRFYALENVRIGGTEHTAYVGASLPERSATVRWFQVSVQARYTLTLS